MLQQIALLAASGSALAACSCNLVAQNGSKIDMAPMGKSAFKAEQNWIDHAPETKVYTWDASLDCVGSLLFDQTFPGEPATQFNCDSTEANDQGVIYRGTSADGRAVTININCDMTAPERPAWPYKENPSDDSQRVTVQGDPPALQYTAQGSSKCACAGGCTGGAPSGGGGISEGGDFFIAFIVIIIVGPLLYIGIGAAFMFKFKERRGIEVIPHLEFWKEFPFLVVAGFQFVFMCKREFSKF